MKLSLLILSSVILVATAAITGQPEHDLANGPDVREIVTGPSSASHLRQETRAATRDSDRSSCVFQPARFFASMRRRLLPCIYQEHADDGWKNTIIGMTRIWSMVLYYKERVPKGLREKVMQSSLPHPDVPVPEYHDATTQGFLDEIAAYAATIEESEHQLAAGKANIEESEHQLPADEANTEESEHQSASSETTNEQLVADPWRSTLMERGDGYRVVLFDKSRLLNDYCDRRGLCSRQPRMLKEFKKFTTIFGYMPYDERYQLPVGTQDTVTLDEALRLLATTPASQQGEINGLATSHHAEDGLERASSKSENIQPQETGAYTHQDELNDHDETTENHDGSSTSNNPPNQNKILHVLIGKQPEVDQCPICVHPFEPPEQGTNNQWNFSEVARINSCRHDFHPECIQPYFYDKNSLCPICCTHLQE